MGVERGVRGVKHDVFVVGQELLRGLLGHAGTVQQLPLQQRQVGLQIVDVGWRREQAGREVGGGRGEGKREKIKLIIISWLKRSTIFIHNHVAMK